ncbi:hypothetical protein L579_2877 [Pantoea sp. AS-PWVM4]|nr:hypothetical protein L579_2877 [Pantoea sp. AS-PWVM4]
MCNNAQTLLRTGKKYEIEKERSLKSEEETFEGKNPPQ